MMGVKPGDCGVVIGYQVGKFIHKWLTECSIPQSHIYPDFMGKLSTLTHFPLETGCEDYSFMDQAVEDHEHGLDSICMDSVNTLKLYTSFGEPGAMPSSVSLRFLCFGKCPFC